MREKVPYPISDAQRQNYASAGYIKLDQVLPEKELRQFAAHLNPLMEALNPNKEPLEKRSTYRKAFNQVTNLWQKDEQVKQFVFQEYLARIAAEIMGVDGVRLYHDQALFKEGKGGATPWHVDQVYWPIKTSKTCTFWIPLQDTSPEMGALQFAAGSHRFPEGRDLVISDESESFYERWVERQGFILSTDSFRLGDISVHSGWTVHHTAENTQAVTRAVMTIIYMDSETRLAGDLTPTQEIDRQAFTPGIAPGERMASPLNPVLYHK